MAFLKLHWADALGGPRGPDTSNTSTKAKGVACNGSMLNSTRLHKETVKTGRAIGASLHPLYICAGNFASSLSAERPSLDLAENRKIVPQGEIR
jgi:hypothetical protein